MILKNSASLLKTLKAQLEVCKKYLNIQTEMTSALVAGDIKQVDLIVRDEQSYIMKIESLEKQREKLLEQELLRGLSISEITVNHLEEEEKEEYKYVTDNLISILIDLKKVNALNQKLLKQRLSVLEHIVQVNEMEIVKRA